MLSETLADTLKLKQLDENLFEGTTPWDGPGLIYGGQVIAQSLLAAYETIGDRLCHSLHGYFIRAGDAATPVTLEVERVRDGGSFSTRRVSAIQHGKEIFSVLASFQVQEEGLEHHEGMPGFQRLEDLKDDHDVRRELGWDNRRRWMDSVRPIEVRTPDLAAQFDGSKGVPCRQSWIRCRHPICDDPRMQQAILAYASDINVLSASMRPHGLHWDTPGLQAASLDHAIWFHRPVDMEKWHLYQKSSPSTSGGRGLVRGAIFAEGGALIASVAQEGLMRMKD